MRDLSDRNAAFARWEFRLALLLILLALLAFLAIPSHAQTSSGNQLQLTLRQLDANGTPVINRTVTPVVYNGVVGTFAVANLASGANVITLPVSPVLQLYLRNNHATNTVTVILTPQGGASATVQVLGPGAALAIWQSATAGTYGITALTLTANGANTPVEYFLGG